MPGSGKQSNEVQAQIKELLEAGFDPTTIHRRLKVGRSSIYRMKRCLELHGSNYMPPELNKKNGRPKVLTAEQELEVLAWLRVRSNRNRYLDDLVWLCHDRFHIVCSTTTMSKMKRKWLRVIEYEETGQPIDETTRKQLLETHPDLPLLQQIPTLQTHTAESNQNNHQDLNTSIHSISNNLHIPLNDQIHNDPSTALQHPQHQHPHESHNPYHPSHPPNPFPDPSDQDQAIHPDLMLSFSNPTEDTSIQPNLGDHAQIPKQEQKFLDSPQQIDARLERQIQDEIANATAVAAVAVADGGR